MRIYLYPGRGRGARHPFTAGTFQDLKALGIVPATGVTLQFYCDDLNDRGEVDNLIFDGVVGYDQDSDSWYAVIEWDGMRHESES